MDTDPTIGGIILDLPVPPSVNRIWRANKAGPKRVSKSREYVSWLKSADALAMSTGQFRGIKTIVGPFEAHIIIKRVRGDLDNRGSKALLDWLQSRNIIADDKYLEKLTMEWGDAPSGVQIGRAHV